ncbi:hypothetical protein EDD21DRAFT_365787 [Dissophora ornata]|nr:hypothetical protein EDD21DRAFT_365787 [Dissophora ornata]
MCHRTICQDCGKFTWTGCGLHITQVLAGLPLEQICSCDDDRDSEHSWASLNQSFATNSHRLRSTTRQHPSTTPSQPTPATPETSSPSTLSTAAAVSTPRTDPTGHCIDPSPVEYKLSKISSTTAEAAANRMSQQAAAMEELRRIKQKKEQALKEANENALQRLLRGLAEVTEDAE